MRETVERILNGKFDYERGTLDIKPSRIELTLFPGEEYTGSFTVTGAPGHMTEGTIYSNNLRLRLINDSFSGLQSEIGFTFSAKGLEEGENSQGEIVIISNQGEYYLPYVITVSPKNTETSLGTIKNLFHFTNLAKSDWREACRLFYSEDFLNVFSGNDLQYKKIYLGLSKYYDNEQNVEEFLLSINKKQPIEFIPEQENILIDNPEGIVEEYINITRNGWGYTLLHVESDADFITFEKSEITDNEFLGNYVSFPIHINTDKLHGGSNFASIRFFNPFVSFSVNVTANVDVVTKPELSRHLEYENAQYDMMTFYEAFRTKKISVDTWIAETSRIVDRMLQLDDKNLLARLFKAQLLMTDDRYNEAKWILDQAENEFQNLQDTSSAKWAYYLYLTTLYDRQENYINEITGEIWNLYRNDQTNWHMAWFLLYLSEDFAVSASKKWLFIEETIEKGCSSPMFYVEAINMLTVNPGLLNKLSSFEIKVIRYALDNDLLTKDMSNQFVYLASKIKTYTNIVFNLLVRCYEFNPSPDTASIICELLIEGDRKDAVAHEWYARAIEEELRITKVYEYYMDSLDLSSNVSIPKMVYLYFSYESELDWEHNAFLYANLIEDREEYPDIFETYRPIIERFTVDEIINNHINRDMAVIYRFMLPNMVLTDNYAENLSKLLFTHKITVKNRDVLKVIVYESRECAETVFTLSGGVAYVPLYSKDCTIMFEDGLANRYVTSIPYDCEKLMVPGRLASMILPSVNNNLEFDVYACECSSEMVEINDETRGRYQKILEAPEIDRDYKSEVRGKIMQYYYDNDSIRELDEVLEKLEPKDLNQRERLQALRFMVIRGMYDRAMEWVKEYGTEGIDIKDLLKLTSKIIIRDEYAYDRDLLCIATMIFSRMKHDEVILKYLIMHYQGMLKDKRRIFKASESLDVEIYSMCESMLLQMLYTGYFVSERMDIYRKYIQGGADPDIQAAFLAQCSYDYFVKEQLMESFVFDELTKCKLKGFNIQTVVKLAYLKYFSENQDAITDTVLDIIKEYLDELIEEGIYMSFFKNFMENTTAGVNRFSDKTFIEYKTDPGRKVFIHYVIEGDSDAPSEYVTEEMHDMYGGVHSKAFILFFGESLLYYITEECDGEEQLTVSDSVQKSDISRDIYDSRFNEVNDIVIAKTLEDYDTVDKLLYEYHKHAYVVKKLFKLD